MKREFTPFRIGTLVALVALSIAGPALAQDRPGFLDNLFNRGEPRQEAPPQQGQVAQGQPGQGAGGDPNDLGVRIDRIENALRQLTGTVEQLQFRNQQLEQQVRALQGGGGAATPPQAQQPNQQPMVRPGVPGALTPSAPSGRRSDVFDPAQHPNAPGAPRTLGNASVPMDADSGVGAPNGRAAGAPLDLSTLSGNQPQVPGTSISSAPVLNPGPVTMQPMQPVPAAPQGGPPRNVAGPPQAGPRLATLPPSAKPQDEYDLAYGYILHKDYALAEQAFRDFMRKYPSENLVPDAQYWLGESLYQRQKYRDAAEAFLAVSTKYDKAGKAPNSLLRLGQSLAALNQKEAACATLSEVGRKYPKASASVKRGVTQEIKRVHC